MKAYLIQPPYSRDPAHCDAFFEYKLRLLDRCGEDADLIVLPEYSDVPCATATLEETLFYHNKYIAALLEKCAATAKRCGAHVFVNALSREETGWRTTTRNCGSLPRNWKTLTVISSGPFTLLS